ncbi:MAG TPA: caspase family protein, partial [Bacteroidota bacterium]|nr:caspase family protein [Bacteroidota bacterium]
MLRRFLVSILFICFTLTLYSQEGKKGVEVVEEVKGDKGKTWALIIGISKYQKLNSLKYADRDALSFYDFLKTAAVGEVDTNNIKVLLNENATRANIVTNLKWLMNTVKENDKVIFYFSGHGDNEKETVIQEGFLLCNDSNKDIYDEGGISMWLLTKHFVTILERKAKLLIIIDACKAGKINDRNRLSINFLRAFGDVMSQATKIVSSQEKQYSLEGEQWGKGHGVFTYYLLRGLMGLADTN